MADFYNDRKLSPYGNEDERPLDRDGLIDANARLRAATPVYRQEELRVKIRTTSVQRHRARKAGQDDFGSVGEYLNFMTGMDDGGI